MEEETEKEEEKEEEEETEKKKEEEKEEEEEETSWHTDSLNSVLPRNTRRLVGWTARKSSEHSM